MKAGFIRIGLYLALALPTESDPWHGMSDAERMRGDAEAYPE